MTSRIYGLAKKCRRYTPVHSHRRHRYGSTQPHPTHVHVTSWITPRTIDTSASHQFVVIIALRWVTKHLLLLHEYDSLVTLVVCAVSMTLIHDGFQVLTPLCAICCASKSHGGAENARSKNARLENAGLENDRRKNGLILFWRHTTSTRFALPVTR